MNKFEITESYVKMLQKVLKTYQLRICFKMDITIGYFSAKLFIEGCQFLFNYTLLSLWAVHKKVCYK